MKDYIPPGYLSLSDALDLVGRHLFGAPAASGEGLPAQAIDWLRNLLAEEQVPASAIIDNGQIYKVGAALWSSQSAEGVFATGLLPAGTLRQALIARQEGTLRRRVLVPTDGLKAALRNNVARAESPARQSTIGAETRCYEWLVDLMHEEPKKKPKHKYLEEAQSKFGVSKRAFNRVWGQAIAETGKTEWSKPGR